jgi:hypothetical protein
MKLSFHEGKFSVPCSFSMDRRLLWEDDSGKEEDDDMIATEGEREGRGEKERERERERERRQQQARELADCKSVEER